MKRYLIGLGLVGIMFNVSTADTVIVDETFESYADDNALSQEWFFGSPTNVRLVDEAGFPDAFPEAGKGVQHDGGTVMDWLGFDDPVQQPPLVPTESQSIFVRGDVYDDGLGNSANKRMSIGLRGITPGASNLLELGFYNSDSCDPTVCGPNQIGDPPSGSAPQNAVEGNPGFYQGTSYGYRMQLFAGIEEPLLVQPDWQYFQLPIELDRTPGGPQVGDYNENGQVDAADYTTWRDNLGQTVALPNESTTVTPGEVTEEDYTVWKDRFGNPQPDGLINSFDVGAGWHRYQATITPNSITVEIDLYRDGLRNTSRIPDSETGIRPGTPGVDASVTWSVISNTAGYDSFRFGGPSNLSSAGGGLIYDNLYLAMIDVTAGSGATSTSVPEPSTIVAALLSVAAMVGVRRPRG